MKNVVGMRCNARERKIPKTPNRTEWEEEKKEKQKNVDRNDKAYAMQMVQCTILFVKLKLNQ